VTVEAYRSGEVTIEIDTDRCSGLGNCRTSCPVDVFEIRDGVSTAPRVEVCIVCCECVKSCPTDAIQVTECERD
jgi:NAD-dependent dihydropyrimidine dehydrogenase PreA subunit